MRILIPGGAGYIGAVLVPFLLADGHKVRVLDSMWFGNAYLPDNGSLEIVNADLRDEKVFTKALKKVDAVIYLASISNNEMSKINPKVFEEVNREAFEMNYGLCVKAGVKKFIYASSVAGYDTGERPATEEDELKPHTRYSAAKIACERIVKSSCYPYIITRSASVCGYSPNQRFDTTLNKMVHDGCTTGVITVNGGDQVRSHVHIKDVCSFYRKLLSSDVENEVFNIVAENQKVSDTAELVSTTIGAAIISGPKTDARSYAVSGAKASQVLGWHPKHSLQSAILDMEAKFDAGYWKDTDKDAYRNINRALV